MAYDWSEAFNTKDSLSTPWEDYPSENTALEQDRLNFRDNAVKTIDNRVLGLNENVVFSDGSTINAIKNITYNSTNGKFTITYLNDSTKVIDTTLEYVVVNFSYDKDKQKLILKYENGTTQEIDLSDFVKDTEFKDTDTIGFTNNSGVISANVLNGSITDDKIEKNYLSNIKVQAQTATDNATLSKSYAVGGTSSRTGEDTDNAKYYAEESAKYAGKFIDDTTGEKYKLGIDNGLVYIEPVSE
jgi:hypothetical protein